MRYDVSLQTIAWLRGRRADGTLLISPKFQRRPVWLDRERSELIETILLKLPFPEIYIHHQLDPQDGTEKHIVVDGQQRVTSILMFINNEVALPFDDDWQGQYFRDLTDAQREQFWNYKIVVRDLSETNDVEIRDLFAKLNTNNIALNDQELRNAKFKGRFIKAAERLADYPLFQEIGLFTPRDIRRMLDVEYVSELLLRNIEGVTNKKDMLDDAYLEYETDFPGEATYEAEFNGALTLIRSIALPDGSPAMKTKTNFYSLYGACLRQFRASRRTVFKQPDRIKREISDLLDTARAGNVDGRPPYYREYFEAVSRAASDRARRAAREDILCRIIDGAERGDGEALRT